MLSLGRIMQLSHSQYLMLILCLAIQLIEFGKSDHEVDWIFPDGFLLGASTSSYQIEGAWNESDKGENVWDRFTHTKPDRILNGDNGDVACDSYHKLKEDVQLLKLLGMDHYRFSLSWTRILPTGFPNVPSKDGIKYYHDLLDELEKYNIKPVVTIYHFDRPQVFEDIGGWTSEKMVDLFANYARFIFQEFGHRIKIFITINQPFALCQLTYNDGIYPPGIRLGKSAEYLCNHNTLKAHAKAYHIYNNEFRAKQQGKIGISLLCNNFYSKDANDSISEEVAFQYSCGRYANPIFSSFGDYPEIMKTRIAENSKYEGLERSRLPILSKAWIDFIKGSADFFSLNHYTSAIVEPAPKPRDTIYANDDGLIYSFDPNWPSTPADWIKVHPDGFRRVLKKIKMKYGNIPIFVTENGIPDEGSLHDCQRQQYLYLYMKAMLLAINEDGCNVIGYTIWSLIDNFQFTSGYSGFGKSDHEVDWIFPDGFLLGASTSSYQIEGAWNESDKGENVWDRFTHTKPDRILNGDNGDVACDSYHKFKEDVQLLKLLGMDHYRFSLSWTRILPTGFPNVPSKDGIKYYHDLLDELEKYNIKPVVTIYHYDHPQVFEDIGGWTSEKMVDLFANYARFIFQEFGHRIKIFITINEPYILCQRTYYYGIFPPGIKLGKFGEYLCNHNTLKAHAKAYHIYNNEFRAKQQGKIGISLSCRNFYSKDANDSISEEVAFQFNCGRYGNPIFSKFGDYPEIMKTRIAENSKYEGLERSRLPILSKEWIDFIKGSADFFSLNHYTSHIVEPAPKPRDTIYANDDGLIYSYDPNWPSTPVEWLKIHPDGFRGILKKIKMEYGNIPILVTENGIADEGSLYDNQRQQYLYSYMKAMLQAINEDGCNVIGYTIWSLIDNFQLTDGYSVRFGIFHVDFEDPNRKRTAKFSVHWLRNVLRTRKLQPICDDA